MAKALARWSIERGGKLRNIEHLMASQTPSGVIFSPFQIRFIGIQAIALAALWLFYPLGSQASLRAIGARVNVVQQEIQDISYMNPSVFADMRIAFKNGSGPNEETIDPQIASSLYPREAGLQYMQDVLPDYAERARKLKQEILRFRADAIGNPRVPKLESLPGYDADNPHEWVNVPRTDMVNYASLIGVRVKAPLNDTLGNNSFTPGANYFLFSVRYRL